MVDFNLYTGKILLHLSMAHTVRIKNMKEVSKPWGRELIIVHTEKYALKDIVLRKGARSSLQSHARKLETIFVLDGEIQLEICDIDGAPRIETYVAGDAYTIPPGMRHRVTAIKDARLIEVSTPELDDVIRHQDDFGRVE